MLRVLDLGRGDPPPAPARIALDPQVVEGARSVLRRVRSEGDGALVALTREHDEADVEGRIRVEGADVEAAADRLDPRLREALGAMAQRLLDLHRRQLPRPWEAERDGVRFGEVVRPVASAGCYVPGGRAAYPSSVLMTACPARAAGVPRVVLATPPGPDGDVPDAVLYAARAAGVDEVFRLGGAQAIGAMAYGTESVPPVDVIVGPGNVWVTAAKREVTGLVGIDGLAGPTELVVVADETADASALAVDLVAQSEHDPLARTTLISLRRELPDEIERRLATEAEASPRREIVDSAIEHAVVVLVPDEEAAAAVVDRLAPEHVQVVTRDPRAFLERIRSFGAAFLGPHTAVTLGDYGVGSNHVLPTMGTARFASGLRASAFVRVSAFTEAAPAGAARFGPEVEAVARAEGLAGHARASEVRR